MNILELHQLNLPPVGFLLGVSWVCVLSLKLYMNCPLRNFHAFQATEIMDINEAQNIVSERTF